MLGFHTARTAELSAPRVGLSLPREKFRIKYSYRHRKVDTRGTESGLKESVTEHFQDPIGNRNRNLSSFGAVPQQTAPPLVPNDCFSRYRWTETLIYTATCDKMRNYGQKHKEVHVDEWDRPTTD
jgi:hypothetical protein